MKKFLAMLLVLVMALSLVACGQPDTPDTTPSTNPNNDTNPTTPSTEPTEPVVKTYTYNYALAEFPTNWNYHTYQTATDADILDYITDGFYSFDYNDDMTGYKMVDSMAIGDPVDVTAEYVGQFGLAEGAKNQAYIINLRQDLYWENGDHITAHDFVESVKRLLAPEAQNYRADTIYSGSVKIHNAESYLKQGQTVKQDNGATGAYAITDFVKGADGNYTTPTGEPAVIAINNEGGLDWLGGYTLKFYVDYYTKEDGTNAYFSMTHWAELSALADENGYAPLNDDTLAWLTDLITGNPAWGETAADAANYIIYDETFPEMSFDQVGWFAKSDYELVFIMDAELSGFYLKYNLPAPLVHIETYDACTQIVDGVYTNTYCTSAENTMSYGPYVLDTFQADKQYTLSLNPYFHGKTDDNYMTTNIVVDCVKEASTRLELFLEGKLDTFGLSIDYMDEYQLSDHTYYSTGDSTFAMVFNPDYDALVAKQADLGENFNKTIITVKEFRQAMSYALDRNAFCLATSPLNAPGFGLYSGLIVSDPEAGTAYRSTEVAKNVLANFWGVADDIGEGKFYADLDEAVDSITGYNLAAAKELFNAAYDKAIADGLMDADDIIEIKIGTPNNTSTFYNNGYEFLVNNYTEAVKGTKLEGKLTFTRNDTLGNAFSDALKNNDVDMLFGVGWTGSALDPYGLMEAYVKPSYQYDDSTDFTAINCTIAIDGVNYTTDVWTWYTIMNGEPATLTSDDGSKTLENFSCGAADNNPLVRLEILGALEGAVLQNYNFLPIMDDASASLKGMQITFKTEEYVFGMGFGGLKYYTYNYSDAEWADFVAANNNELDYH